MGKYLYMRLNNQVISSIYNQLDNFGHSFINKSRLHILLNKLNLGIDIDKIIIKLKKLNKIKYVFDNYYYILNSDEQIKGYYKYSVEEMVFIILNKLKIKWYLGLHSAVIINNLSINEDLFHQIPKSTIIINSKYSKRVKILNQDFIFRIQKNLLSFGIVSKKTKNKIIFNYSDLERTYIDYLYYTHKSPISKNLLNINIVKKYLLNFPKDIIEIVNKYES
jgi:hypothetical protein